MGKLIAPFVFEDFLVRSAVPADAAALERFETETLAEEALHGRDPDELPMRAEEKARWLEGVEKEKNWLVLVAERNNRLIGFLELLAAERPRANSHVGRFHLTVRKDCWGQGIGSCLLSVMLDWARGQPEIEKISLGVLSTNKRAIKLYKKFGFQEEGRKTGEFRAADGSRADDVFMALFLKEE